MNNAITWFEIPTPHIARAQAFYELCWAEACDAR